MRRTVSESDLPHGGVKQVKEATPISQPWRCEREMLTFQTTPVQNSLGRDTLGADVWSQSTCLGLSKTGLHKMIAMEDQLLYLSDVRKLWSMAQVIYRRHATWSWLHAS